MASTGSGKKGEAQQKANLTIEDLNYLVDSDGHVFDSPISQWVEHIDDKYEAYKKEIERSELPWSEVMNVSQPSVKKGTMYGSDDEILNTEYTAEKKAKEMDDFSITHSVISESLLMTINTINNPRFAQAVMNGYNNWVLDEFGGQENDGMKGTILVSEHRPEKSAEEIDRLADEDYFVGVSFPPGITLGSHKYDPIYQAAEDHGLPLTFHGVGMMMGWEIPFRFRDMYLDLEKLHGLQEQFSWAFVSAFSRGMPERFPDLDIVYQEFGLGQVAPLLWKLDDWYVEMGDDVPALQKPPSQYIDDQFWFTSQPLGHPPKSEYMAQFVEQVGPSNIIYSADLPHQTFDTPSEFLNRINGHFSETEIRGMMGENAAELFGLKG